VDRLVVAIVAEGQGNGNQFTTWANADLAGVNESFDTGTSAGSNSGAAVAYGTKATAGSVGAWTATKSSASALASITIAFKPPIVTTALAGRIRV